MSEREKRPALKGNEAISLLNVAVNWTREAVTQQKSVRANSQG